MSKDLNISFEFFPAKDRVGDEGLWESFTKLEVFNPKFVSVTFGAGGGERDKTDYLVKKIKKNSKTPVAGHLTCVDMSKDEINNIALDWLNNGINNIVALRGDVRTKNSKYQPHPKGIKAPIIPGILPIGNFQKVKDFSIKCGTSIPKWIEDKFSNSKINLEDQKFVGVDIACNIVNKLQAEGVNEFHFYTLNKYELSYEVCKNLLTTKKVEKKEYDKNTNQFIKTKEIYI